MKTAFPSADLPLQGVRVVDTVCERGELAGRLLADLGAEVIRIEPPGGSSSRRLPPLAPGSEGSLHFALRNAGKKSLCLDLSAAGDRAHFSDLLARADVWLDDGELAGAQPWSEAERAQRWPRLIVATISDFGRTGPYRDYLGSDMIGVAMGGMLYRAGVPEKPPVVPPGVLGYDAAAVSAAFAVIVAFLQREQCGSGQTIDVSVQEAVACLADWSVPLFSTLGMFQHREGAGSYPLYQCRDGWLRMMIFSKRQWRALLDWMDRPESLSDPSLLEYWGRFSQRELIDREIGKFFASWDKEAACSEAQRRGLAATPLLRPAEAIDNPHTRARGSFVTREVLRDVNAKVAAGFFVIDGERVGPRGRAPETDEHREQILGCLSQESARPQRVSRAGESAALPFEGLLVLDLGTGVAGPEVGRLLLDYGAEVIKIEWGETPDFVRTVIPGPSNAPFTSSNRGKKSFGVNLKTEQGQRLVRRLAAKADVLIENSAVGVLQRLGLAHDELRRLNPRLIIFSTRLLGSTGPWKEWIGYGPNVHAVSGLQYLWNYAEDAGTPAGSTNIHPDHYVGRLGALAVAAALYRRARSGSGSHIDVAQFEVLQQLIGDLLACESLQAGSVEPRGNDSALGFPWGVYPCAGDDEWCAITVRQPDHWRALSSVLGRPEWAADPALADASGRRKAAEEIEAAIRAWTREREPFDAMDALQSAGVPAGVVEHPAHQTRDPHLIERGFFESVEQPALGAVTLEGACFRASGIKARPAGPAPLLGEHTREICRSLLELGERETDDLIAAGVLEESSA